MLFGVGRPWCVGASWIPCVKLQLQNACVIHFGPVLDLGGVYATRCGSSAPVHADGMRWTTRAAGNGLCKASELTLSIWKVGDSLHRALRPTKGSSTVSNCKQGHPPAL